MTVAPVNLRFQESAAHGIKSLGVGGRRECFQFESVEQSTEDQVRGTISSKIPSPAKR